MHISWNFLGIFVWAILVIYVFFIIHNIRQRHLKKEENLMLKRPLLM